MEVRIVCDDCGSGVQSYMLRHPVWKSIANHKDMLCVPCAEKRLGRKITLNDLLPCMLSETMLLGAYFAKNTPVLPPDATLLNPEEVPERTFYRKYGFQQQ